MNNKNNKSYNLWLLDSRLIMDYKNSAVWLLAKKDQENEEIAWCTINNHDDCKEPIHLGGIIGRMFSTAIIRRHLFKYHPEELAAADKKKREENLSRSSH